MSRIPFLRVSLPWIRQNTISSVRWFHRLLARATLAKCNLSYAHGVAAILDSLPVDEEFNWVDRVSIELTTQMLATLFDFPFEERSKLTFWSDVATLGPKTGQIDTWDEVRAELQNCLAYFSDLFEQRKDPNHQGFDMLTMLAQNPATQNMPPTELLGNVMLLIVGGNDTTRNSISGGVWALNQFPDQYEKLRSAPELIPNMVAEIIRWQTPLTHMGRTALRRCGI